MTLPSLYRQVGEMRTRARKWWRAMHQELWQALNEAHQQRHRAEMLRQEAAQHAFRQRLTERQMMLKALHSQLEGNMQALRESCTQGRMYRASLRQERIDALNHLLERDAPKSDPTPFREKPPRSKTAKARPA